MVGAEVSVIYSCIVVAVAQLLQVTRLGGDRRGTSQETFCRLRNSACHHCSCAARHTERATLRIEFPR